MIFLLNTTSRQLNYIIINRVGSLAFMTGCQTGLCKFKITG